MTSTLKSPQKKVTLYNATWPADTDPIDIEIVCIQKGGRWKNKNGTEAGLGLAEHYKNLQKLLWPDKAWHRWNNLLLESMAENRIVGIVGPASSGKTHEAACFALCNYFAFPEGTTIMVSSTDIRSLELRVWGEIKKYWRLAKQVWENCPGDLAESRLMITTSFEEEEGRDFRNGIVGVPCVVGGKYVGLSKYVGIKNTRVILVADECQFMAQGFFDAIANLNKNPGFRCTAMGNPADWNDPLGKICEPSEAEGGIADLVQEGKTKTWKTRIGGLCVQLVGTDSPNYDVPRGTPPPYPFLITPEAIEKDLAYYGPDSLQFSMMNLGVFPKATFGRRVLTAALCQEFKAHDPAIWLDEKRVQVAGLDAAYSSVGGDRSVLVRVEFGLDVNSKMILSVDPPVLVPVTPKGGSPEDQVAAFVMQKCNEWQMSPSNLFFDSTGRGTLMASFARLWSPHVQPVEFGGRPSERIVSKEIRKTCREHYSKFVTELWFSIRLIVESGQMRNLPREIMEEGCMREWKMVAGNKIEVEPKEITKQRMGRSPDLFDALVTAVEGARRRGFHIARLASRESLRRAENWINQLRQKQEELRHSKALTYSH